MLHKRNPLRILGSVTAGLLIIILIPAVGIQLDRYVLRRNADRLLTDLKSLEMRRSTFEDAQRVRDGWDGHVHGEGPCDAYSCDLSIQLGDFLERHLTFFVTHQRAGLAYRLLGGRPARIDSYVRVRKNIVWGKGIEAWIAGPWSRQRDGTRFYWTLIGRAKSGLPEGISSLHPEYSVGSPSGCSGCSEAHVIFTPYADPSDVNRLMDINFSCLTRWKACQTKAEILPTAWNEAMGESRKQRNSKQPCASGVARVLSRVAARVAIGRVVKSDVSSNQGEVSLALAQDLKPGDFRSAPTRFSIPMFPEARLNRQYILFFDRPKTSRPDDNYRGCDFVPATAENILAARSGVAEECQDQSVCR